MDIDFNQISEFLMNSGIKILLVIIGGWILKRFGMKFIERLIRSSVTSKRAGSDHDKKQREDTLISIFHALLGIAWWAIISMLILDLLGVNIGPLIAGAGVAGVALGFGGQWLIRDLIAGTFIILENQFRVGDVVTLDAGSSPVSGLVEEITLRMTMLRDLDGQLHHVPNGSIVVATNLSKNFSGINLDINIGYNDDLDKVIEVINKVGQDLSEDPEWKDKIIEAPSFLRIDNFADSSMIIKITGTTKPLEQWAVTGELRKRIKLAFDKAKITIPFPQRVIHTEKS